MGWDLDKILICIFSLAPERTLANLSPLEDPNKRSIMSGGLEVKFMPFMRENSTSVFCNTDYFKTNCTMISKL